MKEEEVLTHYLMHHRIQVSNINKGRRAADSPTEASQKAQVSNINERRRNASSHPEASQKAQVSNINEGQWGANSPAKEGITEGPSKQH
jgi:hypothetical protein